jgi:Zn-dependent peptidase ImmA (M78 family)
VFYCALMDDKDIRARLEAMKSDLGSWYAVAKELGISQQYLSRFYKDGVIGRKLLDAMGLEIRYVKAK